jgi:hypothetical protein
MIRFSPSILFNCFWFDLHVTDELFEYILLHSPKSNGLVYFKVYVNTEYCCLAMNWLDYKYCENAKEDVQLDFKKFFFVVFSDFCLFNLFAHLGLFFY